MFTHRIAIHPLRLECGQRLLERLDGLRLTPNRILDLASAPAAGARELAQRFPHAQLLAITQQPIHLKWLKQGAGRWRRRYQVCAGHCLNLPPANPLFDLVHAPLLWPPQADALVYLHALRQQLKPGGLLLMSTLGADSLNGRLAGVPDVQALAAALTRAGFLEPVLDSERFAVQHGDADDLQACARDMGLQPEHYPPDLDAREVRWELLQATAWAAEPGMPVRSTDGEEASVPVDQIKVRQRS